ncbi:4-phosphopantetheinyl transferase family protein [Flavobacterium sufflavum]|uniref:4-phosphopantetheinyl transferase family protein n=1 Tax=Flavobacterium sufflavum TaxID=1921138 RepID=A0A437KMX7_9FLAO|nr:4'-phosphopantetheinyl transferase superfamily protein [Flavobacterium sufflavum]RVT72747.1 4-phosphopantetheinyl transferase family protein [Flavobacterium sufflavum]
MIGNDIVDLALARKESNWKRKGFLDKIFNHDEQLLVANTENPEVMVWNLWSRKEAAYKVYNREIGIRGFIPMQLICFYENEIKGTVSCNGRIYYTETIVTKDFIYTIATAKPDLFSQIKKINSDCKIIKTNGIPFVIDAQTAILSPVSITHHGRFWEGITL